jgi:hypothetical protein
MSSQKPFGYQVVVEVRTPKGTRERKFRKQGTEATVRRYAALKRGFLRVLSMDPYTEEQWVRVFGYAQRPRV